jgi:hypothetical protein
MLELGILMQMKVEELFVHIEVSHPRCSTSEKGKLDGGDHRHASRPDAVAW